MLAPPCTEPGALLLTRMSPLRSWILKNAETTWFVISISLFLIVFLTYKKVTFFVLKNVIFFLVLLMRTGHDTEGSPHNEFNRPSEPVESALLFHRP